MSATPRKEDNHKWRGSSPFSLDFGLPEVRSLRIGSASDWITYLEPRNFVNFSEIAEFRELSFVTTFLPNAFKRASQEVSHPLVARLLASDAIAELPGLYDEVYRNEVNSPTSLLQAARVQKRLRLEVNPVLGRLSDGSMPLLKAGNRPVLVEFRTHEHSIHDEASFPSDTLCEYVAKEIRSSEATSDLPADVKQDLQSSVRTHIKSAIWGYFRTLADSIRHSSSSTRMDLGNGTANFTFSDPIAEGIVARIPLGFNDKPPFAARAYNELSRAALHGEAGADTWRLKFINGSLLLEADADKKVVVTPHPERTSLYDFSVTAPALGDDSL